MFRRPPTWMRLLAAAMAVVFLGITYTFWRASGNAGVPVAMGALGLWLLWISVSGTEEVADFETSERFRQLADPATPLSPDPVKPLAKEPASTVRDRRPMSPPPSAR